MKANRNKDYSVVKTFKAGQLAFFINREFTFFAGKKSGGIVILNLFNSLLCFLQIKSIRIPSFILYQAKPFPCAFIIT